MFRDVDSLRGGVNWKKSIARTVSGSELVLAVIGPHWQELLQGRQEEEADWVCFELNQARSLDIPIIPLVLGGTSYAPDALPEELAWLADLQSVGLADGQGRWESDMAWLVQQVAALTSLQPLKAVESTASLGQVSQGHQSPNIDSGGGNVTINFGTTPDGE